MLLNYGSVSSGQIVFLQAEWEDTATKVEGLDYSGTVQCF